MYRLVFGILVGSVLTGCVSISEVVPPGSSAAALTVSTNQKEQKNIKVRYQGVNSCSNYPGKLIGIINSITTRVDGGNPIRTRIPAGGVQVISVMGMAPMRDIGVTDVLLKIQRDRVAKEYGAALRELYFAFSPIEGREYHFQFDLDGNDVTLIGYEQAANGQQKALESLPLPDNCKNIPIKQM